MTLATGTTRLATVQDEPPAATPGGTSTTASTPTGGKASGETFSMGTIASAPAGTAAPVMIGAAAPETRSGAARPAGMRAATRRLVGPSGSSPAVETA